MQSGDGEVHRLTASPATIPRPAGEQRVAVRGLTLHRAGEQALTGAGAAVIAPGATGIALTRAGARLAGVGTGAVVIAFAG